MTPAEVDLEEVRRGVVRYLLGRRLPREDVEDIAQEVCIAVLKVLPRWEEQDRPLWAYVFTVVRGKLADRARGHARRGEQLLGDLPDPADEAPGPEDLAVAIDATSRMGRLLAQLPDTQRDVLLLRVVVGLSPAEVAEALGLAHSSVHVLANRAMKKLRVLLAEEAVPS